MLPMRYRLPLRYRLHLMDGSHEKELQHLRSLTHETKIAIDVGANEGFYSYSMSRLFSKVYSFEILGDMIKELAAYNPGNIEIITKGLSSEEGRADLYIPAFRGQVLTGWASLDPGNCPKAEEMFVSQVELITFDSLQIHPVSFIKIDVEGHEFNVLQGAARTLDRDRPNVLIEVKPKNLASVRAFFAKLDYSMLRPQELIGEVGSVENYVFIPSERAPS